MPAWLYDAGPNGLWVFLLVTLVMGGLAAFVSGRAVAQTWRPFWQALLFMVPLAAGVRFIHYAIFHEPLLSARSYLVDLVVLCLLAALGYRLMRARQMAEQYGWPGSGKSRA
jgi:hypothetical protein